MKEQKDLESRMQERAIEEAIKYVRGRTFRKKIDDEYKAEFKTLLSDAETRAKRWAGIASLVMVGIFSIAIGLEYANTKTKQAEAQIQYAEAKGLIVEIKEQAASLKETLDTELKTFRAASQSTSDALADLKRDTTSLHGDLRRRMTEFEGNTQDYQKQQQEQEKLLQNLLVSVDGLAERVKALETHIKEHPTKP